MRSAWVPLALGLLAWLPACGGDAFQSCEDTADGCTATSETPPDAVVPGSPVTPTGDGGASPVTAPNVTDSADPNDVVSPPSAPPTPALDADATPAIPDDGGAELSPTVSVSPNPAPSGSATSDESSPTSESVVTSAPPEPEPTYVFGDSLITNGDFGDGNQDWDLERTSGGNFMPEFAEDQLCLTSRMSTHVVVGWPANADDSLELPAGHYRFAYRVRGQGVRLWAKVGHAYEPYEILFEKEWNGTEAGWHDVVHEFTFDGDDAAGVAFNIDLANNTVCLDDVSLQLAVDPSDAVEPTDAAVADASDAAL